LNPLTGIPGESVCINVTSNNFNNVGNLLLTHEWDAAIMEFDVLRNVHPELMDLEVVDATNTDVTINWTGGTNISLPLPNTTLYELCFHAL